MVATWRNPELGMHREVINGPQVVRGSSGAPKCFCTIDSVLPRRHGDVLFICKEGLVLLICAAHEVLRMGVQQVRRAYVCGCLLDG